MSSIGAPGGVDVAAPAAVAAPTIACAAILNESMPASTAVASGREGGGGSGNLSGGHGCGGGGGHVVYRDGGGGGLAGRDGRGPPVLLDQWHPGTGPADPTTFTTVGTWQNKGHDIQLGGETYQWSKHLNFRKLFEVPRRTGQPMELATDLNSGPDYERAVAGGFKVVPALPMSLNPESYRQYISSSRGEFTAAKDLYVRTRSGWFSDRSACYLAAGRPVITQRTGFEKFIPTGVGLLGFDNADEAVKAVHAVNADYANHARAARELACEYFDALKLLDEIAQTAGM